jgi:hypothetical protein
MYLHAPDRRANAAPWSCSNGMGSLPSVDLTTFTGQALHAWRLRVPSHPSHAERNCETSSAGSPQTWCCAWTSLCWHNWTSCWQREDRQLRQGQGDSLCWIESLLDLLSLQPFYQNVALGNYRSPCRIFRSQRPLILYTIESTSCFLEGWWCGSWNWDTG